MTEVCVICETSTAVDLATCDVCGGTSCGDCRQSARGSKSRCVGCNEILPHLGVKGACGDGSCDV